MLSAPAAAPSTLAKSTILFFILIDATPLSVVSSVIAAPSRVYVKTIEPPVPSVQPAAVPPHVIPVPSIAPSTVKPKLAAAKPSVE